MSIADGMEKLAKLHADGALSSAEFAEAKAKLLAGEVGPDASPKSQSKPLVTGSGLAGALGCLVIGGAIAIALLIFGVGSATSKPPRQFAPVDDVEYCKRMNLHRIRPCDSECRTFRGDEYDACVLACAARRGDPVQDCD